MKKVSLLVLSVVANLEIQTVWAENKLSIVNDPVNYTGQVFDSVSSTYNLDQDGSGRPYDPVLGVFLVKDSYPLMNQQSYGVNPVNGSDPSGHVEILEHNPATSDFAEHIYKASAVQILYGLPGDPGATEILSDHEFSRLKLQTTGVRAKLEELTDWHNLSDVERDKYRQKFNAGLDDFQRSLKARQFKINVNRLTPAELMGYTLLNIESKNKVNNKINYFFEKYGPARGRTFNIPEAEFTQSWDSLTDTLEAEQYLDKLVPALYSNQDARPQLYAPDYAKKAMQLQTEEAAFTDQQEMSPAVLKKLRIKGFYYRLRAISAILNLQ